MDLTQLFKASVKTVRLRCKTLPEKNRILKIKNRDDFLLKANDVRYQVSQLRELLIENRTAYMRFGYHLKTAMHMSDIERDIIDNESEKIIIICNQYINDLRAGCNEASTQFTQHKLALLDILQTFTKNVYKLHKEQKENRIRHEMETLKLLKLRKNVGNQLKEDIRLKEHIDCSSSSGDRVYSSNTTEYSKKIAFEEDEYKNDDIDNDDYQKLEFENSRLLQDFRGLSDEVEQIEKHVTGIAKLQEIFTEKVCSGREIKKSTSLQIYFLTHR